MHADDSTAAMRILVLAVTYRTDTHAHALVRNFKESGCSNVDLVVVNTAPDPVNFGDFATELQVREPSAIPRLQHVHYQDNPGYVGGARRALSALVAEGNGPLPYSAVALCNVDLAFSFTDLEAVVEKARSHTGDLKWILAPDTIEAGRSYHQNPQRMHRPENLNNGARHHLMRVSFTAFRTYRWLYRIRRRRMQNPFGDSAEFTQIFSANGAMTIFGSGYFAAGGTFHEAPLFAEEYGFAEQAWLCDVPVFYMPSFVVIHEAEASTSRDIVGDRQRYNWYLGADDFYRSWKPEYVVGAMSTWFVPACTTPGPADHAGS